MTSSGFIHLTTTDSDLFLLGLSNMPLYVCTTSWSIHLSMDIQVALEMVSNLRVSVCSDEKKAEGSTDSKRNRLLPSEVTDSWLWLWPLSCRDPAELWPCFWAPYQSSRVRVAPPAPSWGMEEAVRTVCDWWYVMHTYPKHSMGDKLLSCDLRCFYKIKKKKKTPDP